MINIGAIYVLWLREMKRYMRAKSRIVGTLVMPLFFLAFMGLGLTGISLPGMGENINYLDYLVPGIVGMSVLFASTFAGVSVLWDREFGFLKEIMVAPVNRLSIALGRIAGGTTIAMIQGASVLGISLFIGFTIPDIAAVLLSLVFMMLIAVTFIGLGLVIASKMRDIQGFGTIVNFVIFPIFFLSGALAPLENFPEFIKYVSYMDPLTYGVDGLRGILIGASSLPVITNFIVLLGFAVLMVFLGAYFFEKSESV